MSLIDEVNKARRTMTGPDSTDIHQFFTRGTGPMREIVEHFEDEEVKAIRLASISAMAKKLGDDARARKASIDDNLRRMPGFHKPKPRRELPPGWWIAPGLVLGLIAWGSAAVLVTRIL